MGEYGASIKSPVAEAIWLSPEVADASLPVGGDDGVGGYAPLAVVTGSGSSLAVNWVHGNHLGVPIVTTNASGSPRAIANAPNRMKHPTTAAIPRLNSIPPDSIDRPTPAMASTPRMMTSWPCAIEPIQLATLERFPIQADRGTRSRLLCYRVVRAAG